MVQRAFRFAPSPNGFLHLGHAYSALLNSLMAQEMGGRFLVRIEDIDTTRCTAYFARAALEDLAWLGLRWEEPVRVQSEYLGVYGAQQARLMEMGLLYPCFCSRRDIQAAASGALDPEGQPIYPGTCRHLSAAEVHRRVAATEPHALRVRMEDATSDPAALAFGDVVIARKDIGTSYHVAVVTDDHLQAITDVVRGRDLEAATAIHRVLQKHLGFATPSYHHHPLIGDERGRKLSKSEAAKSLRSLREEGLGPGDIRRLLGVG